MQGYRQRNGLVGTASYAYLTPSVQATQHTRNLVLKLFFCLRTATMLLAGRLAQQIISCERLLLVVEGRVERSDGVHCTALFAPLLFFPEQRDRSNRLGLQAPRLLSG